jgi:hypothetical protein
MKTPIVIIVHLNRGKEIENLPPTEEKAKACGAVNLRVLENERQLLPLPPVLPLPLPLFTLVSE